MNTKYDWSNVPERIKWMAFDKFGDVRGFVEKPRLNGDFWIDEICPYYFESNMVAPDLDFINSLEPRPCQ